MRIITYMMLSFWLMGYGQAKEAPTAYIIAIDASGSTFLLSKPNYTGRLALAIAQTLTDKLKQGDRVFIKFIGEHNSESYISLPERIVSYRQSPKKIARAVASELVNFKANVAAGYLQAHESSNLMFFLEDMVEQYSCADTRIYLATDGIENGAQRMTGKQLAQGFSFIINKPNGYAGCHIHMFGVGVLNGITRNQQNNLRQAWREYFQQMGATIKFSHEW